ncbi:MAG: hypothetical protein ACK5MK_13790 [Dysgonomonas sp.]
MIKKNILSLILLFVTVSITYAQVGINTENPNKLTELDIRNIINGNDTVPKGIMIPRMTEAQRNEINVTEDMTLANGLFIYNTDEDCFNYYSKTDKEWKSLCGKLGKAEFTIPDCSSIIIGGKGTYFSNKALDASHYLQIKVNVTKPGSYNITAIPESPGNGYYFTINGEFLATGSYTIIVPGAGTPQTPSANQSDLTSGDKIAITLNGTASGCENVRIHIIDSTINPVFTMNCGSGKASGTYKIGTVLDASNYITMTIVGDVTGGTGAKAVLKTNTVEGMYFVSNPINIIGGVQVITLYGVGTPTSAGSKTFTISSNSTTSTSTCNVTLNVVMKKKRILAIGTSSAYGYNIAYSGTAGGGYDMMHDARNFGTLSTSVLQIENLEIIDYGSTSITPSTLNPYLSGTTKVDMVVIAYNSGWTAANSSAVAQALGNYVKNGNPLFLMADNNGDGQTASTSWTALMRQIFDGSTTTVTVQNQTPLATGYVYRFSSVNHPILNGLFGDIRGQYWGEDASYGQIVLNLPMDEIIQFSGAIDVSTPNYTPSTAQANGVTSFVHRRYPFIYVGDGGFGSHDTGTAPTICPFKLDSSNYPAPKYDYGRGTNKFAVSNSTFIANAIAWGLRIVEGIEHQ